MSELIKWDMKNAEKYQAEEFRQRMALRVSKSHDYASDGDILANFKRVALLCDTLNIDVRTPFGYAQLMCILKIDRINNLISSDKEAKNESIKDSFRDLKNYIDLSEEILIASGKINPT